MAATRRSLTQVGALGLAAAVCLACAAPGCDDGSSQRPRQEPEPQFRLDPLPVQQAKAYPETVTGLFVSLADFEDSPFGERGRAQVAHFAVVPESAAAALKHVVNVTRTGVGALEVHLPPHSMLRYRIPQVHDFRPWSLLSMAVYSEAVRDDLRVILTSGRVSWTSHHVLLNRGWNTVLIDIQRLSETPGFDTARVETVGVVLADATGPVRLNVDDIMLVENNRRIEPTPEGIRLSKAGLDCRLELPGRKPMVFSQWRDGLWRLSPERLTVNLVAPNAPVRPDTEDLRAMGRRRIGRIELLEHNAVRVRLANTWFFPTRAGEWLSLAVRRIRWTHTFYGDGRWVVHFELNNAGGEPIRQVGLAFPTPVAWAGAGASRTLSRADMDASLCRFSCLVPPPLPKQDAMLAGYLRPGPLRKTLCEEGVFAAGDADRDGFDETQGCYFLQAKAGHCRFTIMPRRPSLLNPVFRVGGQWTGPVHVSSDGLAIRNTVPLKDGSVLFELPGQVDRPTAVEVVGRVSRLAGR
ncbi:MAG TPA: hypothetical protein VNA25_05200 [Phycisphaerae bacterium]|nr:hypothetical protein [Phycisphaerae bacterium]